MGSMTMLVVTVFCVVSSIVGGIETIREVNQEPNVPTDSENTDVIREKHRSIALGNQGRCDVLYGQKCFTLIISRALMTLGEAEVVCKEAKGKLANVYGEEHYNMLRALIRSRSPMGVCSNNAWLGMTVDESTTRVKLSNGEWAPYVIWVKTHPKSPPRPHVGLFVECDNLNTDYQGYYDLWSTNKLYGAVCESKVSCDH